jgi:hypothetical protein
VVPDADCAVETRSESAASIPQPHDGGEEEASSARYLTTALLLLLSLLQLYFIFHFLRLSSLWYYFTGLYEHTCIFDFFSFFLSFDITPLFPSCTIRQPLFDAHLAAIARVLTTVQLPANQPASTKL